MSMVSAPVDANVMVQSAAQLKDRLWADPGRRVYAVAMAARFSDLPARLDEAMRQGQLDDYDCLWPGAVPVARRREAPYLLSLRRSSGFTEWLLFEAAADHGPWGLLLRTTVQRLALRSHLRPLLRARLLDGSVVPLDWMDPEVLPLLLAHFDASGLLAFAGPVTDWVAPAAGRWVWTMMSSGRLEHQMIRVPQMA